MSSKIQLNSQSLLKAFIFFFQETRHCVPKTFTYTIIFSIPLLSMHYKPRTVQALGIQTRPNIYSSSFTKVTIQCMGWGLGRDDIRSDLQSEMVIRSICRVSQKYRGKTATSLQRKGRGEENQGKSKGEMVPLLNLEPYLGLACR